MNLPIRHALIGGVMWLLAAHTALAQPTAPTPAASAPGPAASAPRPAATPPRPPGAMPPFAEVTRDAKRAEGFLPIWTREEKTWIEVPAELLDKPIFFGNSLASGIGDAFVWPGLMSREHIVVLRRVGNSLQLLARNLQVRAPEGTPLARTVEESFSESLLAAAPLVAAPHAQNKALLVEAFALLGGDITGMQTWLETAFRMPYALDRANSSIARASTDAAGLALTVRGHFAVPKLPAPPPASPGGPPPNPAALPNPPRLVPDARSFFINTAYTLAPLPANPMRTRRADQRVGFFTTPYVDYGDERSETRRVHLIERWRLEKKDPAAEVSEPKEPVRVVMDRNIPEKWREPVRQGILEWNKAFERAGFRNALAVEQQAADASWDSVSGTRMLAVRWFGVEGSPAAVGPSQSDPRTGEILRGAAIIPESWVRLDRSRLADTEPRLPEGALASAEGGAPGLGVPLSFAKRYASCSHAEQLLERAGFALNLLIERGSMAPEGPEVERYIRQSLKDVTMHEVGHALGLRHNFRSSAAVTAAQLRDPAHTRERGLSNSVMDYNDLNMPLQGEVVADYHQSTLGAYDYWAIEYGYREWPAEQETAELARLAARSEQDPNLAYGTDEDLSAYDPRINHFDLGGDVLAHVQRKLKLVRELWQRTEQRTLRADDDMTVYRRNLTRGFIMLSQDLPNVLKYLGGSHTSRALAGAGQPVSAPVPVAQQRAALELVLTQVFDPASFRFDPSLMSRLGINHLERLFGGPRGAAGYDFSLGNAVGVLQRGVLDGLMSESLAVRLANAESRVRDPASLLGYAEVQERLAQSVWAELAPAPKAGKRAPGATGPAGAVHIESLRRNLQREHLRRLASVLLRPLPAAAADVRAVHRLQALVLQAQLKAAVAAPATRWSATTRAHLDDSLATLNEALKAPLAKQGV